MCLFSHENGEFVYLVCSVNEYLSLLIKISSLKLRSAHLIWSTVIIINTKYILCKLKKLKQGPYVYKMVSLTVNLLYSWFGWVHFDKEQFEMLREVYYLTLFFVVPFQQPQYGSYGYQNTWNYNQGYYPPS